MDTQNSESGVCAGYLMPHPPILLPEIGRGRECDASVTGTACQEVAKRVAALKPDTVVIISPHAPIFSDYLFIYDSPLLTGDFSRFESPKVAFSCAQDTEFRENFTALLEKEKIPAGMIESAKMERYGFDTGLDHGVMVPLSFLLAESRDFRLVALSQSALPEESIVMTGRLIAEAAKQSGKRVCVIASGDMSHKVNAESPYGMVREGALFDRAVCEAFRNSDMESLKNIDIVLKEKAAECGYRSILMMTGALPGAACSLLSYEAPFGIGYCVAEMLSERRGT